ncbi:F-box protein At1g30790 [Brassica rapa]|uniref:F-box domain-containing protein n=1 Tax=Brassica campestris TaxID=3711 RepID=M4FD63_BRACM|nr:F-box protein At1g30790 [Brassica rapa]
MKTKEMEDSNNEGVITTFRHSLDSIPLDLISDILLKFPAKSLVEFTCISNTWYSIIRSQMFIKTFMSISISRPRILLTFKRNHNGENELLFFSSPDTSQVSNDSSSVVSRHEMTMSRTSLGDYIIHSPSVRGFLCCSHQHQYMVCNPTTRQVINLPEDHRFDHGTMKCYMHLGYDPSSDKYKVLRMVTQPGSNLVSEHSVYTLERQQCSYSPWRCVEGDISNYIPSSNGVCINGVVYYEARIKPWISSVVLVTFDFGSERFCQIKTPGEKFTCLANYKGKLAGLSLLGNSFNLWVLDDVKEQTWSKTDTFVLSHTLWNIQLKFSGTTDAGELVFAPSSFSDDFHVFYFDIKEKTMRRVKLEGVTNDEEFRCRRKHLCYVSISCDHVENIYLY